MSKYTRRKGTIRLYDGTGTPYYLELKLDVGDFNGPIGSPKTEEELVLHRGTMDTNAHYVEGSDEPLMAPVDLSFSAMMEDTTITTYLLSWLEGGTVNAHTIATTKQDTQRDGANNNPAFADAGKKTFKVEIKWEGSADVVYHFNEVYFPLDQQKVAESDDMVQLSLSGKIYGTITRDTAFTSGTDVTA